MPTPPESSRPISAQAMRLCEEPAFQRHMGASDSESARIALLARAGVVSLAELEREVFDGIVCGYLGKGKNE